MTRRMSFLVGLGSGLFVGVSLAWVCLGRAMLVNPSGGPRSVTEQVVVPTPVSRDPMAVPLEEIPKGWQRREFNGQPYYLVPLASTDLMGVE